MCKLLYDKLQDIFQVIEKKYDAKKVEFYQLFSQSPIYLITENRKIVGMELIGFKDFARSYYKSKKKELGFTGQKAADDFIKGSLYNLFKLELANNRMKKEGCDDIVISSSSQIKVNIKDFCLS